jgi:hypothetical protein
MPKSSESSTLVKVVSLRVTVRVSILRISARCSNFPRRFCLDSSTLVKLDSSTLVELGSRLPAVPNWERVGNGTGNGTSTTIFNYLQIFLRGVPSVPSFLCLLMRGKKKILQCAYFLFQIYGAYADWEQGTKWQKIDLTRCLSIRYWCSQPVPTLGTATSKLLRTQKTQFLARSQSGRNCLKPGRAPQAAAGLFPAPIEPPSRFSRKPQIGCGNADYRRPKRPPWRSPCRPPS